MFDQGFGDLSGTMAVGIGLDDRHDIAFRRENATNLSEIMNQGCQINCGNGWQER